MLIGVPKEIKNHEYRRNDAAERPRGGAPRTPGADRAVGGPRDRRRRAEYVVAGAEMVDTPQAIFAEADMIVKVKEPQAGERKMLRPGQILYTYLHLAPDPEQTKDLVASGAVCIAYETVTGPRGGLPLMAPMSQVAGRM
jgi:alanine dehydrogenase